MHCTCILRQFFIHPLCSLSQCFACTSLAISAMYIKLYIVNNHNNYLTHHFVNHSKTLRNPKWLLPSCIKISAHLSAIIMWSKKKPFHPQSHISSAVLFSIPSINILPYNLSSAVTRSSYSYWVFPFYIEQT